MPNPFTAARLASAGASLVAIALLVLPAAARDARTGAQLPVAVSSDLEREWLLQISPGSGVMPGYSRPDLSARTANPKTRSYPGYARPAPGVHPGYAEPARRYGYTAAAAVPSRATIKPAAGATVEKRTTTQTGLFAAFRRPAAAPPQAKRQAPGLDPAFLPQDVAYAGGEAPGTLVIDTNARFLYLVGANGSARRYGVGVGKPGFEWAGRHKVTRKSEWPTWTPPEQMRARERAKGRILPVSMRGGPENPLGARAMYLGSTLYRIHGTNQPWTIGKAVSSGCIRMRNEDVTDLYERVPVGTSVIVL